MREEVGETMQKKMGFQINEIGEIETLHGFSHPFSVTGGGLLSHSSDSGDNEITQAGGINKSKLISPAPKTQGNLFQGLSVVLRAESTEHLPPKTLIHGAIFGAEMDAQREVVSPGVRKEKTDASLPHMCFVAQPTGEIMRVRGRFLQQQLGVFMFSPHRRWRLITTALRQKASIKGKLHLARRKIRHDFQAAHFKVHFNVSPVFFLGVCEYFHHLLP